MFKSIFDSAKETANKLIEEHWPKIEETVISGLVKISEDHLNDHKSLTSAFESAHAMLPLPFRIGIKRETFVEFCFSHQATIKEKLSAYKKELEEKNSATEGVKKLENQGPAEA